MPLRPLLTSASQRQNDATKPEGKGHKCLIARGIWPDGLNPDGNSLVHLPEDSALCTQFNLCIATCGGPGAARVPGPCVLDVATANANDELAENVTLRLVADLKPSKPCSPHCCHDSTKFQVLSVSQHLCRKTSICACRSFLMPKQAGVVADVWPTPEARDRSPHTMPVFGWGLPK